MGEALPTSILIAPEDDWRFFSNYRHRCAVSNLSSRLAIDRSE
jgi:hypothetical protein